MCKDFTFQIYKELLSEIKRNGFNFQTLENFIEFPKKKVVILRHDIDRKPKNALKMAVLENELDIKSSYYFRIVPASFHVGIIQKIKELGHEIGYHYEDLAIANGDFSKAIKLFEKHLNKLRKLYPVRTICMHGRPLSKFDSRDLWKKYNYKDYGIVCEPYFDLNFDEILYLTDAGRHWDNENFNRRDKINTKYDYKFSTTKEIVNFISMKNIPDKILINIHPEHWAQSSFEWWNIYLIRKIKNYIKAKYLK